MKHRLDRELKQKAAEMQQAEELMEKGDFVQAVELMRGVRAEARKRRLPHGMVSWRLCVFLDHLDDLEEAFVMAVEAVDQDPLSASIRNSFHIIAKQLRDRLAAPDREPADPTTPRLYSLLSENDAAEDSTHLAMARFLVQSGDAAGARRLLDAVTVLSPNCAGAWALLESVAKGVGDEELAKKCEVERLAIEAALKPMKVAGQAAA